MKIADLDMETRSVMAVAEMVSRRATKPHLKRLREVMKKWHSKHEEEMALNLIRALDMYVMRDQNLQNEFVARKQQNSLQKPLQSKEGESQ